jgi:UDP-N-acetylglucosamine 2-epimerase (non-hydrolysing)
LNKLNIKKKNYFLLSVHREENIDNKDNFKKFLNLLNYLEKRGKEKVVVSTHPRTMKKLNLSNLKKSKNIIFHKPFSYVDYSFLQLNSKIVLSDSGSITEESNIMGFEAINLRSTNERQEGMEYGAVPMSHFDLEMIEGLISTRINKNNLVLDYECKNFSNIFLNILLSYTSYINEYTWKKKD